MSYYGMGSPGLKGNRNARGLYGKDAARRESRIMRLRWRGFSLRQIAKDVGCSPARVGQILAAVKRRHFTPIPGTVPYAHCPKCGVGIGTKHPGDVEAEPGDVLACFWCWIVFAFGSDGHLTAIGDLEELINEPRRIRALSEAAAGLPGLTQ